MSLKKHSLSNQKKSIYKKIDFNNCLCYIICMKFYHYSVMLKESIEALKVFPQGIYFDGTLGGGGHTNEILSQLTTGVVVGVDKDLDALNQCKQRFFDNNNIIFVHNDFNNFNEICSLLKINNFDGIILDLGVSSYQLDNAERGFSYNLDAELDMRMDSTNSFSAKNVVNEYSEQKLKDIFYKYGEERFSSLIAKKIVQTRETQPIETTKQLSDLIKSVVPKKIQVKFGNPCKRVFQAIRIEVNGELDRLEKTLYSMIDSLKIGGRICVITFHSLEDRIVKNAFKNSSINCKCPPHTPICICGHKAKGKLIINKPITASEDELNENSRSASAKLRILERI